MPNSQNRSNGKSGIVQPKRKATKASGQQSNPEGADLKKGGVSGGGRGSSGRSSDGGRKNASGGTPNA